MDFTQIMNALMPELTSLVLCLGAAGAAFLYHQTVQRLPASVRTHVDALAHTAVAAIEQKYSTGSPGGAIKKQEAVQLLFNLCKSLGVPLNATHANAVIEAAVFELNAMAKARTVQTPTIPMPVAAQAPGAVLKQKPLAAG